MQIWRRMQPQLKWFTALRDGACCCSGSAWSARIVGQESGGCPADASLAGARVRDGRPDVAVAAFYTNSAIHMYARLVSEVLLAGANPGWFHGGQVRS